MHDTFVPTVIVTDRELALINAIGVVFPTARHLLCRWHISKNVVTNCKKMFEDAEKWEKFLLGWNTIVYSSTEEEYAAHCATLVKEFRSYAEAIRYVNENWLVRYREKFVSVWTDSCMHLGNTATNR
jgi:histone-lysine N-methyltransferase SETD2